MINSRLASSLHYIVVYMLWLCCSGKYHRTVNLAIKVIQRSFKKRLLAAE